MEVGHLVTRGHMIGVIIDGSRTPACVQRRVGSCSGAQSGMRNSHGLARSCAPTCDE
jgi:hypothetical protein